MEHLNDNTRTVNAEWAFLQTIVYIVKDIVKISIPDFCLTVTLCTGCDIGISTSSLKLTLWTLVSRSAASQFWVWPLSGRLPLAGEVDSPWTLGMCTVTDGIGWLLGGADVWIKKKENQNKMKSLQILIWVDFLM